MDTSRPVNPVAVAAQSTSADRKNVDDPLTCVHSIVEGKLPTMLRVNEHNETTTFILAAFNE
jgi:hypothetical protein